MSNFKGKVVIVTGSNRGIGYHIAKSFAAAGANVAGIDITDASEMKEEVSALGGQFIAIKADVSNSLQIQEACEEVMKEYGRVDILINNAAVGYIEKLENISQEQWKHVIDVNLTGVFSCSQVFGKQMIRKNGGVIINIGSFAGFTPMPTLGAYSVAKAGVAMLTKLFALEWSKCGIRVNSVCPGLVRTPLSEQFYSNPEIYEKRVNLVPQKRIGSVDDVAKVVLFLASDDSSSITGQSIIADGGLIISIGQHVYEI